MNDSICFLIIVLILLLICHILYEIKTEVYFIRCALNRIEKDRETQRDFIENNYTIMEKGVKNEV